jgi:hypothetical protein
MAGQKRYRIGISMLYTREGDYCFEVLVDVMIKTCICPCFISSWTAIDCVVTAIRICIRKIGMSNVVIIFTCIYSTSKLGSIRISMIK